MNPDELRIGEAGPEEYDTFARRIVALRESVGFEPQYSGIPLYHRTGRNLKIAA